MPPTDADQFGQLLAELEAKLDDVANVAQALPDEALGLFDPFLDRDGKFIRPDGPAVALLGAIREFPEKGAALTAMMVDLLAELQQAQRIYKQITSYGGGMVTS